MSQPMPAQPCDVCGATIPEGHAVFAMRDALHGAVVVMCRDCDALDAELDG
jgi:RNase P subunit RPR2